MGGKVQPLFFSAENVPVGKLWCGTLCRWPRPPGVKGGYFRTAPGANDLLHPFQVEMPEAEVNTVWCLSATFSHPQPGREHARELEIVLQNIWKTNVWGISEQLSAGGNHKTAPVSASFWGAHSHLPLKKKSIRGETRLHLFGDIVSWWTKWFANTEGSSSPTSWWGTKRGHWPALCFHFHSDPCNISSPIKELKESFHRKD